MTDITSRELRTPFRIAKAEGPSIHDSVPKIRNGSFRTVVDSRGLAHSYEVQYVKFVTENSTISEETPTIRVRINVTFTNVGNTTVTRPPWYDNATE